MDYKVDRFFIESISDLIKEYNKKREEIEADNRKRLLEDENEFYEDIYFKMIGDLEARLTKLSKDIKYSTDNKEHIISCGQYELINEILCEHFKKYFPYGTVRSCLGGDRLHHPRIF